MRFKDQRCASEFQQLTIKNERLLRLITALEIFCENEFKKDICITSIYRTQEEHDALYANTPLPDKPGTSPHCFWEACDIRSSDFDIMQIDKMLKFLNAFTFRHGRNTALYHKINGNAYHFHIQCGIQ